MNDPLGKRSSSDSHQGGFVAGMVLRLLLLFLVLGQVVFLLTRHSLRWDLTGDKIFTLTPSTGRVLGRLEDRLFIEAYFSDYKKMPARARPLRQSLKNLLEEYVELAKGKIVLKYYDPQSDPALREKALRLGIQPQRIADTASEKAADASLAVREVWQGLRLRYADKKQEVIPFLQMQAFPYGYERMLTPRIKNLASEQLKRIGLIPTMMDPDRGKMVQGERIKPQAYNTLFQAFRSHYQVEFVQLGMGQLVPDYIDKLIVMRPKGLGDRTKYALDQFLMRGGKLVIFVDTHEFAVQTTKSIYTNPVQYDAPRQKHKFLDQLAHYGVDVGTGIVNDMLQQAWQVYGYMGRNPQGQVSYQPLIYPYCFAAVDKDWKEAAGDFATRPDGTVDDEMKKAFERTFAPGVNKDHELFATQSKMGIPGFFWPCKVGLQKMLPEDVTGMVLLRTSPLGEIDPPTTDLEPFKHYGDAEGRLKFHQEFQQEIQRRRIGYTPKQIPLAVELKGRFSSFFADKEIPQRPKPAKPEKIDREDEGEDPLEEKKDEKKPDKVAKQEGPQPEEGTGPKAGPEVKDPPIIKKAEKNGLLLVIGDADFLRDDYLQAQHLAPKRGAQLPIIGPAPTDSLGMMQQGGQPPRLAGTFFANLLDWLAEDRDLLELQNRTGVDRSMIFVKPDETGREPARQYRDRVRNATFWVKWANILGPCAILLLAGLLLTLRRKAEKRSFLQSAGL